MGKEVQTPILDPKLLTNTVTKITAFVGGSPDGRCNYSKHQFGLYSESEDEGTAAAEDIEVVESSIAWEREYSDST
ncbi:hypothetical protein CVT26_001027 [Gymnopilus dilepis]|uniref:Uncharacterized protein n=1 Tax=Gymnopilus dilepis TaxID=231916 RepID=A0A409Y270_9AGAR|nr:hypothetical protein CVT26_001027 [Gymnopilus dilepis]